MFEERIKNNNTYLPITNSPIIAIIDNAERNSALTIYITRHLL